MKSKFGANYPNTVGSLRASCLNPSPIRSPLRTPVGSRYGRSDVLGTSSKYSKSTLSYKTPKTTYAPNKYKPNQDIEEYLDATREARLRPN